MSSSATSSLPVFLDPAFWQIRAEPETVPARIVPGGPTGYCVAPEHAHAGTPIYELRAGLALTIAGATYQERRPRRQAWQWIRTPAVAPYHALFVVGLTQTAPWVSDANIPLYWFAQAFEAFRAEQPPRMGWVEASEAWQVGLLTALAQQQPVPADLLRYVAVHQWARAHGPSLS